MWIRTLKLLFWNFYRCFFSPFFRRIFRITGIFGWLFSKQLASPDTHYYFRRKWKSWKSDFKHLQVLFKKDTSVLSNQFLSKCPKKWHAHLYSWTKHFFFRKLISQNPLPQFEPARPSFQRLSHFTTNYMLFFIQFILLNFYIFL